MSIRKYLIGILLLSFGLQAQVPYNIAPRAEITASSSLSAEFGPERAADGKILLNQAGEWACQGDTTDWGYIRLPWIQFKWDTPQKINRVILYDRVNLKDHIAGGQLRFSDGSTIRVNQIPNNGFGKEIKFDTKTVDWVKFEVTDGKGRDLGFSEIEIFSTENQDFVSWVDPYIETNRGRYIFFITGQRPFGMVGAAPLTRNKNQYGGGYNYNETEIQGFEQIHCWMLGGLEIMPASSKVQPQKGRHQWKSEFSHDDEIVRPGYQRVFLRDPAVWVENTATDRVSMYKFTYTREDTTRIITNLNGYVSNVTMQNARVNQTAPHEFEGSFSTIKRYWGGPEDVEVFFVIQFDRDISRLESWNVASDLGGVSARFPVKPGDEIKIKIAVSYTSVANARNNLNTELTHWDFEQVRDETFQIWNTELAKIKVSGGTKNQKIKFYTDLWHVLLGRHKTDDVSGDYPDRTTGTRNGTFTKADFKIRQLPKDQNGKVLHHMYNSDAWWLTQWNLNVLWGLAWPEVLDEMASSMVQYARNGYLLPRGPSGGGYSYIMTGSPAVNLVASAFQKNMLTKVPADTAYRVLKQNLLPGGMLGSSGEIEFYTRNGYWPDNAGITLEANFQDFAFAEMAKKLGRSEDFHFFSKRAGSWVNLFDKRHNLIFPKNREGKFMHSDPLSGKGWVEANAWQATWSVSHDLDKLAELMGGKTLLAEKLNFAFEKAEPSDFVFEYSGGYVSYANQPGCSNAHVFNLVGSPWLSQYWVRKVQQQAYSGTDPDTGYGGHDEDQGQMGGISALMSVGLFSVKGTVDAEPSYEITGPVFDSVEIRLDPKYYEGDTFKIITKNNSEKNMYIQSAQLNGKPHNSYSLPHRVFAKGGILELELGPAPNKSWGN